MMLDADGQAAPAFGSMGGKGQPQTHVAMVTRLLDFGYDVQQAIETPRWLMGRLHPDGFLEGGADPRGDGAALGY